MEIKVEVDKELKDEGPDKWEIENACDTLLKAEMIKADPEMMKCLKPYLDKKAKATKAITSLKQLKSVVSEKMKEEDPASYG